MRQVTVHDLGEVVVIEVDGDLDIVTAYDLRRALDAVLRTATRTVHLDLSKVATADEDGVATLAWCSDQAIAARRTLMWSRCSQPLVARLRTSQPSSVPRLRP